MDTEKKQTKIPAFIYFNRDLYKEARIEAFKQGIPFSSFVNDLVKKEMAKRNAKAPNEPV